MFMTFEFINLLFDFIHLNISGIEWSTPRIVKVDEKMLKDCITCYQKGSRVRPSYPQKSQRHRLKGVSSNQSLRRQWVSGLKVKSPSRCACQVRHHQLRVERHWICGGLGHETFRGETVPPPLNTSLETGVSQTGVMPVRIKVYFMDSLNPWSLAGALLFNF